MFIMIDSSLLDVMTILRNYGYDMDNKDSKVLYEAVYRTFIKTFSNSVIIFICKFINININKFESL